MYAVQEPRLTDRLHKGWGNARLALNALQIEALYRSRTSRSAAVAQRAGRCMPGGDTRATVHHEPYPLTFVSGAGAYLTDLDGHDYVDLLGNYTALVHGNAYPPVVDAARAALAAGSAWAGRSEHQIELARLLCDRIASVELVRFTNSGSEANMLAVELARAVTGRKKVLMAADGYHGSFPDVAAVPEGTIRPGTLVAPFGDADAFEAVLERHGHEVALVILEPVLGAGGLVAAPAGFLSRVASAARAAGALFCLDEVITLRLGTGGEQAAHGVIPDLTTCGKLIGGGLPVGALGGQAELMDRFDPGRPDGLHHSGTFNGNPVTTAAGAVALAHLTPEAICRIDRLAERLADGLAGLAAASGVPFSIRRRGSLLNVYLSPQPPPTNAARSDQAAMAAFHLAALCHGVFFADRGTMAVSTAMDNTVVEDALRRLEPVFAAVAEGMVVAS